MTPKRHLDFLARPRRVIDPAYADSREFQNALSACLTYHFERRDSESKSILTPYRTLLDRLHERFFDDIYVERPELPQLVDYASGKHLVVVMGPTGTGKSTLLRRLHHKLANSSSTPVYYIDLKAKASAIRKLGESNPGTVCNIVYNDLKEFYVDGDTALVREFRVFRVQNHIDYKHLRASILEELTPESVQDWHDALDHPLYRQQKVDLDSRQDLAGKGDEEALRVLLLFLKQRFGHIVLLIDNIDRYPLELQRNVLHKAIDQAELCVPIIAIRTRNIELVKRTEGAGRYGDIAQTVLVQVPVRMRAEIVEQFVSRRMEFLLNNRELWSGPKELGGVVKEFNTDLKELTGLRQSAVVVGSLCRWYNDSLRHVGDCLATIIGRLAADSDDAYRRTDIFPVQNDRARQRLLRTYVLKSIVCDQAPLYDHKTGVANVYYPVLTDPLLAFPRVFLLDFLALQEGRAATWSELAGVFAYFSIDPEQLHQLVSRMTKDQGASGFGLVVVDTLDGRLPHPVRDDMLIELQDGGEYFARVLRHKCEYLFWSALDTPVGFDLFDKYARWSRDRTTVAYEDTGKNQCLRLRVAALFVQQHIAPRVAKMCRELGHNPEARKQIEKVYSSHIFDIPRTVDSLRKHLDADDECSEEILKILGKIDLSI